MQACLTVGPSSSSKRARRAAGPLRVITYPNLVILTWLLPPLTPLPLCSPDLPHYVMLLKQRIGTPSLIVCLDRCATRIVLLNSPQQCPSQLFHPPLQRLRQLRLHVDHNLAARPGRRQPQGATPPISTLLSPVKVTLLGHHPQRGRALWFLIRRRPLLLPHRAPVAVAYQG